LVRLAVGVSARGEYALEMTQIRGFAIRGLLRFGKQHGLPPKELIPLLPVDVRPLFETQILHSALYPYGAFAEPLRLLDRRLGKGDGSLAREVGRSTSGEDIRGIFQIIASFTSPEKAARRAQVYWGRYSDTGKMVEEEIRKGYFRTALEGFAEIDRLHCLLIEGWNEGGLASAGAREVEVHQKECVHLGGTRCVFEGTWQ
jgi:hypothetical protein